MKTAVEKKTQTEPDCRALMYKSSASSSSLLHLVVFVSTARGIVVSAGTPLTDVTVPNVRPNFVMQSLYWLARNGDDTSYTLYARPSAINCRFTAGRTAPTYTIYSALLSIVAMNLPYLDLLPKPWRIRFQACSLQSRDLVIELY